MVKRELVALLNLSSWCLVMARGAIGLSAVVIVVFPDHTHLLFLLQLKDHNAVTTVISDLYVISSQTLDVI